MNPGQEAQAQSASGRRALLFLLGSATWWLKVGSFLAFLAGVKLLCPRFLEDCSLLTFGRLAPAAGSALVFGWASLAGLACAIFLLARLGGNSFQASPIYFVAVIFWNGALFFGVCSVLAGQTDTAFLFGLPGFSVMVLYLCYLVMALPGYLLFRLRQRRDQFASAWYLLAALLLFPALWATAGLAFCVKPVPGSVQGPIEAWFSGGVLHLCLAPLALGCVLYLVPTITGRRLASYNLSLLAFRCFILFGAWAGLAQLVGGPLPAWLVSAGVVASLLMGIPVLILALNLLGPLRDAGGMLWTSIPLRFALPAVAGFLGFYLESLILALPTVSGVFQFSDVITGLQVLAIGGFVSMAFWAAIYFIVPRLTSRRLVESRWITAHYWFCVLGLGAAYLFLTLGGMLQGFALTDVNSTFGASVAFAAPFRWGALLGLASYFVGVCCFAAWFGRVLLQLTIPGGKP